MEDLKGKNILVVDDEEDLREVVADQLRMAGATVFEAGNGREAFEIVKKQKLDAVISDIRMPGGDGVELLDRVKEYNIKTPVVVLITGFSDLTIEDALNKGASAVFAKPCKLLDLVEAVRKSLLSPEQRWLRKYERHASNFEVKIQSESMNQAMSGKVLNIGWGGMFLKLAEPLPAVDTDVKFEVTVKTPQAVTFTGVGTVRWNRLRAVDEFEVGVGIEFQELSQETLSAIQDLLESMKPKSYIPKG